jgi:hypothetical protein
VRVQRREVRVLAQVKFIVLVNKSSTSTYITIYKLRCTSLCYSTDIRRVLGQVCTLKKDCVALRWGVPGQQHGMGNFYLQPHVLNSVAIKPLQPRRAGTHP